MAEYIDRETLKKQLQQSFCKDCENPNRENPNRENCTLCWVEEVLEVIQTIPAADVRPVVLCRDCIHYEMGVCLKIYDDGAANKDAWQERKPDDFCSYGEDRNVPTNCGADMREES